MKLDKVIKCAVGSLAEYELPEYEAIVLRKATHTVLNMKHGQDDIEVTLSICCTRTNEQEREIREEIMKYYTIDKWNALPIEEQKRILTEVDDSYRPIEITGTKAIEITGTKAVSIVDETA